MKTKCFSCGKSADQESSFCYGCAKIVCVNCSKKYDHFLNGSHGRRPAKRAVKRVLKSGKK